MNEYSGGAHPSEGLPVASSPSRLRLGCSRRKQESLATPPTAQGACWYNAKALLLDFSMSARFGVTSRSPVYSPMLLRIAVCARIVRVEGGVRGLGAP